MIGGMSMMKDLIERQAAIEALDEIRHALWEIDIPSPTVPEYIEHHKQVQSVWKLLDKKQKELMILPSAQPERKKGEWIEREVTHIDDLEAKDIITAWQSCKCSVCGRYDTEPYMYYFNAPKYCSWCGAEMKGKDGEQHESVES